MKLFEGKWPKRDFDPFDLDVDDSELESLARMLERDGVPHDMQSKGPFRGVVFDSPHGAVSVMVGPGTEGMLESYCDGWDMAPRQGLRAHQVYNDYMHGGWSRRQV